MYELGIEAYRMAKNGTPEEALAARRRFQKAAELMRKGPFAPEEMGFDPKMIHMMVRELDHLLEFEPEAKVEAEVVDSPTPKPRGRKSEKAQ
jgi:hypothetical protein